MDRAVGSAQFAAHGEVVDAGQVRFADRQPGVPHRLGEIPALAAEFGQLAVAVEQIDGRQAWAQVPGATDDVRADWVASSFCGTAEMGFLTSSLSWSSSSSASSDFFVLVLD